MLKVTLALTLAVAGLAGCNEDDEVFERIDKLRALGVSASPLAVTPTDQPQVVTLTFHAAVPNGQTVTAEPFVDEASKYAPTVELTLTSGAPEPETYAGFQLYRVNATFVVPPKDVLPPIPSEPGFARLRYALRLKSGDEQEEIVGTYLVYPEGSPPAWADANKASEFKGTIVAPTAGQTLSSTFDITADVSNPFDEVARIGWFVSAGKLRARRAKETQWDSGGKSGPQTVLLTVRGMKSGAFNVQAVDVTVQ